MPAVEEITRASAYAGGTGGPAAWDAAGTVYHLTPLPSSQLVDEPIRFVWAWVPYEKGAAEAPAGPPAKAPVAGS